jgi:hypothetical protein
MDNPWHDHPENPNTICTEIPGPDSAQQNVMDCCHQKATSPDWSMGKWRPYKHDCHNLTDQCLTENGLASPGTPGGRLGCPTCDQRYKGDQ